MLIEVNNAKFVVYFLTLVMRFFIAPLNIVFGSLQKQFIFYNYFVEGLNLFYKFDLE